MEDITDTYDELESGPARALGIEISVQSVTVAYGIVGACEGPGD